MKTLQIISWVAVIAGIVFKILNLHFAHILLSAGTLLLLIYSIVYMVKNTSKKLPASFLNLSLLFLALYVLFILQGWQFDTIIFFIGLVVTIICFFLHIKGKNSFILPLILLLVYIYLLLSKHTHILPNIF
jgi:hypothetical protein